MKNLQGKKVRVTCTCRLKPKHVCLKAKTKIKNNFLFYLSPSHYVQNQTHHLIQKKNKSEYMQRGGAVTGNNNECNAEIPTILLLWRVYPVVICPLDHFKTGEGIGPGTIYS